MIIKGVCLSWDLKMGRINICAHVTPLLTKGLPLWSEIWISEMKTWGNEDLGSSIGKEMEMPLNKSQREGKESQQNKSISSNINSRNRWFPLHSTRAVVLNWGLFCCLEYIWQCLKMFFSGEVLLAKWVKARDATKHPTMHRQHTQQRIIPCKMPAMLRLRNFVLDYPILFPVQRWP